MYARFASRAAGFLLLLGMVFVGCEGSSTQKMVGPSGPPPPPVPLVLTSISPTSGIVGYVQRVHVRGNGIKAGASLTFDGIPASSVSVGSPAFIEGNPPVHDEGTVEVAVINPDGERATLPDGFTFHLVTLVVSPTVVAPGEAIAVQWNAPNRQGSSADWIGLYRLGASPFDYDEVRWQYTNAPSGTLTFTAPPTPGEYEFRYLLYDGFDDVARAPVSVR